MVEIVRGRLTLLMKNSDLDDMTIAEQERSMKVLKLRDKRDNSRLL